MATDFSRTLAQAAVAQLAEAAGAFNAAGVAFVAEPWCGIFLPRRDQTS